MESTYEERMADMVLEDASNTERDTRKMLDWLMHRLHVSTFEYSEQSDDEIPWARLVYSVQGNRTIFDILRLTIKQARAKVLKSVRDEIELSELLQHKHRADG
jgi:hypothetical protein